MTRDGGGGCRFRGEGRRWPPTKMAGGGCDAYLGGDLQVGDRKARRGHHRSFGAGGRGRGRCHGGPPSWKCAVSISCCVAACFSERNDGHAFWARHALLFRVGQKESTRFLFSIALFLAEVGSSWTVSAPRPQRQPPSAGNQRSAVVLSLQFFHFSPVTRASCFINSTQVAGVTDGEIGIS